MIDMHFTIKGEGKKELVVVDAEQAGDIASVGAPGGKSEWVVVHGIAVFDLADTLMSFVVPGTNGVVASA